MSDSSLYLPPNSIPNLPVIVKAGPKACLPNGGSPGSGPRLPWLSRIGLLEGTYPLVQFAAREDRSKMIQKN